VHPFQPPLTIDANTARRPDASFQRQSALRLTEQTRRAALFAARMNSTPSARRSMAVPWRERPRVLAASAITPAATAEVAHATSSLFQPERRFSTTRPEHSANARGIRVAFHRPPVSIVPFAFARSRRSAVLRPRVRAAAGLDRAIREPLARNDRRPCVGLLTTRFNGAIVELSSTVANSQPPPHRPMRSNTNRRPQVTVRSLLPTHSWLLIRVTIRPRITQPAGSRCGPRSQRDPAHTRLRRSARHERSARPRSSS
jgi:hypothetical protein